MVEVFNSSLLSIAVKYTRMMDLKIPSSLIAKDIEEHAHYPSLLSLSDVFTNYGIENSAYQITLDDLSEIKTPVIAFTDLPKIKRDFVLITQITETDIVYHYIGNKSLTTPKEALFKNPGTIIWTIEPGQSIATSHYKDQRLLERKERLKKIAGILTGSFLFLMAIASNFPSGNTLAYLILVFFKMIGLCITTFLLAYTIDKNNSFLKKICGISKKTNCNAVLESNAASFAGMSWSEIGLFYFSATLIFLLLPGMPFDKKLPWLAIINVFAIPYTIFSIHYQWRIVRQWCTLCLSVQAILLMELATNLIFYWRDLQVPQIDLSLLLNILFSFSLPVTIWYTLMPLIINSRQLKHYSLSYKRLLNNPRIFQTLLMQENKVADGWQQLGITIGNPSASNTILKVCNPYCVPCSEAHQHLEEIKNINENVNVKIVFALQNTPDDRGTIIAKHILAIAAEGDSLKLRESLNDWYSSKEKDYTKFQSKYPVQDVLLQQDENIALMREWCDAVDITHTPTFFVNGFRLPKTYSIDEIKTIL